MQWMKSAMVMTSVLGFVAVSANGCSGGNKNPDGGGGDATGDIKVTGMDSGKDAPVGSDAGCTTAPVACEVCDVSGYTAPMMGKPAQVLNACTATQLQAFVTACFSSTASSATCTAWAKQDGGACTTCLNPVLQSSANWGPFDCATSSSPCGANSGGCVDLILKAQASEKASGGSGSCGDAITGAFGCEDYACSTCTTADFQACVKDTLSTGTTHQCGSYYDVQVNPTGPCMALQSDAAPASLNNCFPQTDADNVNFVNVWCGTGM
jgi:hypothetical protein